MRILYRSYLDAYLLASFYTHSNALFRMFKALFRMFKNSSRAKRIASGTPDTVPAGTEASHTIPQVY